LAIESVEARNTRPTLEGTMDKRNLGLILLAVGVLLVVAGLGADAFGIGKAPGIGHRQIILAVVGIVVAAAGAVNAFRKS
jgi:hypothetical protein